jgi:hypothetical protein
MVYTDAD